MPRPTFSIATRESVWVMLEREAQKNRLDALRIRFSKDLPGLSAHIEKVVLEWISVTNNMNSSHDQLLNVYDQILSISYLANEIISEKKSTIKQYVRILEWYQQYVKKEDLFYSRQIHSSSHLLKNKKRQLTMAEIDFLENELKIIDQQQYVCKGTKLGTLPVNSVVSHIMYDIKEKINITKITKGKVYITDNFLIFVILYFIITIIAALYLIITVIK